MNKPIICFFYSTVTVTTVLWKRRSTKVIRATLLLKKDQTTHFFHFLMMSGLRLYFCLFEQEGIGINYEISFSHTGFLCPLVQIPVLVLLIFISHALHQLHTDSTSHECLCYHTWGVYSFLYIPILLWHTVNECVTIFTIILDIASVLLNVWWKHYFCMQSWTLKCFFESRLRLIAIGHETQDQGSLIILILKSVYKTNQAKGKSLNFSDALCLQPIASSQQTDARCLVMHV